MATALVGQDKSLPSTRVAGDTQTRGRLRVLVLHGQAVFAEVLAQRLSQQVDLEVVGAVTRPTRALALVPTCGVEAVVLDWCLPQGAAAVARELMSLEHPPFLIVLGDDEDAAAVIETLRGGALAWVPTHGSLELLLRALSAASRGETWLPGPLLGPVLQHLLSAERGPAPSVLDTLTDRELDVLRCMVAGLDQGAIATRLYLSPNTVRTHRRRTLAKLGVHSSLEAVFVARRAGLSVEGGTSTRRPRPGHT